MAQGLNFSEITIFGRGFVYVKPVCCGTSCWAVHFQYLSLKSEEYILFMNYSYAYIFYSITFKEAVFHDFNCKIV